MNGSSRPFPGPPPDDPDEWSDDQWIAWLRATDEFTAGDDIDGDDEAAEPPNMTERAARSSVGQVFGTAMLGLAEAMYGADQRPAIVAEAGSGQSEDDPLELHLDRDHPERSYIVVRWRPAS